MVGLELLTVPAVARVDGTRPKLVTDTKGKPEAVPVCSPDGTWIAYSIVTENDWPAGDILVVRSDGTTKQRVVRMDYACCPDWRPAP